MPIKPENKSRYPKDWKFIRETVLARAQHLCERCGVGNGERIRRFDAMPSVWIDAGNAIFAKVDPCVMFRSWRKVVRVVLTIAHLDHRPENCHMTNLLALCQRCHLLHDQQYHIAEAAKTRHARKAAGDLFR